MLRELEPIKMSAWVRKSLPRHASLLAAGSATAVWLQTRTSLRHNDSPKPSMLSPSQHSTTSYVNNDGGNSLPENGNSLSPPDRDEIPYFEHDDEAAWASFSTKFAEARASITAIRWSRLGDKIADQVIPEWAQTLPDFIAKLQKEMDMSPGSLAEEIWHEAQDPGVNPEIAMNTTVRISKDLCSDEKAFLRRRKKWTTQALAEYLGVSEKEVDPRDVPTIAMCGSGGGLRALVAGASSWLSAQEAGLLNCITYTAGVSGSCWLQSLYNSSIGGRDFNQIIDHLKKRIGTHIAYPPVFLDLMTRAPTNKYILSGTLEKLKGDPKADFGLVDVYGILLGTRLMVPRDELGLHAGDLKLSHQRQYLQQGENPLPLYTAVRHEIPIEEVEAQGKSPEMAKLKAKQEAWFQWFEFSPYELWCDEFEAGIPSWSIGRHFQDGRSQVRDNNLGLPELRIPFMMGIWGSAFCATLAHYYKEIRPVVKGLAGLGGIDDLIEERNNELSKLHPIDPGAIPNYALGLKAVLPPSCPRSVFKDQYLDLMDAGMANNLPIYPLLRPERQVDIIVCFDASADIKNEDWLGVANEWAQNREIKGWPAGAGWPKREEADKKKKQKIEEATRHGKDGGAPTNAPTKNPEASPERPDRPISSTEPSHDPDLTYCNVWTGSKIESDASTAPSTRVTFEPSSSVSNIHNLSSSIAGLTIIYFPLLPNPSVPGVEPDGSPYLSTWNFIYTPEEIDNVVELARANFRQGEEMTREVVRKVWERKRDIRLGSSRRKREG